MADVFGMEKAKADIAAEKGDMDAVTAFLQAYAGHPHFNAPWYTEAGCDWAKSAEFNARQIVKHKHYFETWQQYEAFRERLLTDETTSHFEEAADAIAAGRQDILDELLTANPALVHTRSLRSHQATLLNYTGANGVEEWRQKTPQNIAAITQLLLDAGAEVDAWGRMYGGTSTLGLAATSAHPVLAGVQQELMEVLISYGADPNHAVAPNYTDGLLILACIHNGRYEPVHYLAKHGATVDFEGACALGDLEKVHTLFTEASPSKQAIGLTWACQYGHAQVVEFLLGKGLPVNTAAHGTTPLLAAAFGGQLALVKSLLALGADIEAVNNYGGSALGQTLWCLYNHRKPAHPALMELFISLGAKIDPGWVPYIEEQSERAAGEQVGGL